MQIRTRGGESSRGRTHFRPAARSRPAPMTAGTGLACTFVHRDPQVEITQLEAEANAVDIVPRRLHTKDWQDLRENCRRKEPHSCHQGRALQPTVMKITIITEDYENTLVLDVTENDLVRKSLGNHLCSEGAFRPRRSHTDLLPSNCRSLL